MTMFQNKKDQNCDVTQRVMTLVDALPQRDVLEMSDIRQWVGSVVDQYGEMAIWHAIRLNGFGGSEIGTLVRNLAGQRADFTSAHDIVEGKLMRRAPLETSGDMTRGHENEDSHSVKFQRKYGAYRDLEAFEALKKSQGSHSWMRYSPDDVVQMPMAPFVDDDGKMVIQPTPGENHRWLIDYKAPRSVDEGDEIAFQYACQLSQGAILCAENDIPISGMMLSQFDWANWRLKDDVFGWNEDIGLAILQAGDHYWNCVMTAQVPAYIYKKRMQGVESYVERYQTAAQTFAALAAIKDAAEKQAAEVRKVLLQPLAGMRLGAEKIVFGRGDRVLSMSAQKLLDRDLAAKLLTPEQLDRCSGKKVYDGDAMAAYLRAQGVSLEPFAKRDLDSTKVLTLAMELGLDADALMVERIVLSPAPSVKAQMEDYIKEHYPLQSVLGPGHEVEPDQEQEQGFAETPTASG